MICQLVVSAGRKSRCGHKQHLATGVAQNASNSTTDAASKTRHYPVPLPKFGLLQIDVLRKDSFSHLPDSFFRRLYLESNPFQGRLLFHDGRRDGSVFTSPNNKGPTCQKTERITREAILVAATFNFYLWLNCRSVCVGQPTRREPYAPAFPSD